MNMTDVTVQDKTIPRDKVQIVYDRLVVLHGFRPLVPRREPMHELISTILSHRTTGANEKQAYDSMIARFGTWEAIRDAPLPDLIDSLSPATFPEVKAPYIQGFLRRIFEERGTASIEFLNAMDAQEALAWLMQSPGVGIKTASLVLLFCFSKPIMPVDTHVHRVSQRVGLIGAKVNPTAAHAALWAILPDDPVFLYNYHIANLKHGQKVCIWGTPRCAQCPLTDICAWYQANRAAKGK
jgi:endonuclease III